MWTLKPYVEPKPLKIDLPPGLPETLGFGVNVLVDYLEEITEIVLNNEGAFPIPSSELCRLCERCQPTWWFERHSHLCTIEHLTESDLQIAHEALLEHRNVLANLLMSLDIRAGGSGAIAHHFGEAPLTPPPGSFSPTGSSISSGSPSSTSSFPTSIASNSPIEYKGLALPIPLNNTNSTEAPTSVTIVAGSPPRSPRLPTSPLAPTSARRLKKPSAGLVSSSKRSPIRIMELLLELCDMALQINVPDINKITSLDEEEEASNTKSDRIIRIHSPHSETKIHQVLDWSSPSTLDDPALTLLCKDTEAYCRTKVNCALRMGNTLLYSEKIRAEFEEVVTELIDQTINRATKRRDNGEGESTDDDEETNATTHYYDNSVILHNDSSVFDEDETNDVINRSNQSIFSDAYLQADRLPVSSTQAKSHRALSNSNVSPSQSPIQHPVMHMQKLTLDSGADEAVVPLVIGTPQSGVGTAPSSQYRSADDTPPPLFGPIQSPNIITNIDSYKHNKGSQSAADSYISHDDFQIADLDLSSTSRLRPRKSLSSLNMNAPRIHGSPLSSLQRNRVHCPSTGESNSPSTPGSSPLFFPYDIERHHHRQSSVTSDFPRNPVSPLLTSTVPSLKPPQPSIRDYEIISPISKGAFGSVYLSRKKLTGELFAIKVLKKADMVAKNQVMNVKSERAIMMSQADSPFVAKLFYTFQSRDYLFLVMEYLNGGDCASLIKALGGLPEIWTRKYIAEVIVGVDSLHKKNIVHRDLKPDNLLIDHRGHLKLIDFGLSRIGAVGRHTRGTKPSANTSNISLSSSADTPVDNVAHALMRSEANRGTSISGALLHDQSISLVPGYFNFARSNSSASFSTLYDRQVTSSSSGLHDSDLGENSASASVTEDENASKGSSEHALFPRLTTNSPQSNSSSTSIGTPRVVLFDPEDKETKRFAGTPDYLAPETIRGFGQDEMSDWWSLGCIFFEFLFGYPPFHNSTPELVFQNILSGEIQWPEKIGIVEKDPVSPEARDLITKLLCDDRDKRLGSQGVNEIKAHPFFNGIENWENLWDEAASFIPSVENPENTDYFDSRGAVMEEFPDDMAVEESEGQASGSNDDQSDSNETISRALSGSPVKSDRKKPKFLPLHIPPHVREGRVRRLSEPNVGDDFGTFAFKNISVLEKANQELISKLRIESREREARPRGYSVTTSSSLSRSAGGTNSSGSSRQSSPVRQSSSGSSSSAAFSHSNSFLTPQKKLSHSRRLDSPVIHAAAVSLEGSDEIKPKTAEIPIPLRRRGLSFRRLSNMESSPELREQFGRNSLARSRAMEISPSSSDTEESRGAALIRVQKRRQLSRQLSSFSNNKTCRILDVLVCDSNPVWRYSAEKMLVELGNRVVSVGSGQEAIRRATGNVKFDLILIEYKLPRSTGADVARLIHNTVNPNTDTPVVAMAVLNHVKEGNDGNNSDFAGVIEKPLTEEKLVSQLEQQCNWARPDLIL